MKELEPKERAAGWDLIDWSMLRRPPTWFAASVYVAGFFLSITLIYLVVSAIGRLAVGAGDYGGAAGADHARNLLIAVGAVLAAPFVVWRTWIGYQQWRTTTLQTNLQDETLNTSLISKAIELLGSMREVQVSRNGADGVEIREKSIEKNVEARIGGLVLLQRIAVESARYRGQITILLLEYVRSNTESDWRHLNDLLDQEAMGAQPFGMHEVEEFFGPSTSDVSLCVQYILGLISQVEPPEMRSTENIVIGKSMISGVDLSRRTVKNVDFSGGYLVDVDFSDSSFVNCIFDGSKLFGCNFSGSNLEMSTISGHSGITFDRINDKTKFPNNYDLVKVESSVDFGGVKMVRKFFRYREGG